MLKNDTDELSVQEQMYIYTLDYARLFFGFAIVLGVILVFILLLFEYMYRNNFLFESENEVFSIFLTLFIIIVPILVWFIITGKKKISDVTQTMNKYTNDVYFMALGLTPHKNDKNIPEDFYKMCLSVFPKLKEANKKSLEKTGEVLEFKKLTFKDDDDDNLFSVTIPNSVLYGDDIFIIKYFEKTNVDYDQLNQYIKIINKNYSRDISRIVCLARNFDTGILKEYEKLRKLSDANLDLIIVTDNGFSGLKI
jgi:hypothetical protein